MPITRLDPSISRPLSSHRRSIKAPPLKARGPIRACIIRYATGVFDAAIRPTAACIMRPTSTPRTSHSLSLSLSLEQCNRVKSVVFYARRQERDGDGPLRRIEPREIGLRHGSSAPRTPGRGSSTNRATVSP